MYEALLEFCKKLEATIKRQNEEIIKNKQEILKLHKRCNNIEEELNMLKKYNLEYNLNVLQTEKINKELKSIKYDLDNKRGE